MGANDKINVGIVGLGTRGPALLGYLVKIPETRVAGLCDVKQEARERTQALLRQLAPGEKAAEFVNMREMFAGKAIDAVLLSVPVHWHGLATVWGCEAGKDVYVEKPASYNIHESRRMIETARKTNRMVQVGLQGRSMAHKIHAIELLRQGAIGKVYMSKGLCFKPRPSMGKTPPEPVPPGIDWDLMQGPAPERPYTRNRGSYTWNWLWDYGAGDLTNAGAHEFDVAHWGLGDPGMPKAAVSTGGKYVWDDDQEAPNTQNCVFDYGERQLVFEIRALPTGPEAGEPLVPGAHQVLLVSRRRAGPSDRRQPFSRRQRLDVAGWQRLQDLQGRRQRVGYPREIGCRRGGPAAGACRQLPRRLPQPQHQGPALRNRSRRLVRGRMPPGYHQLQGGPQDRLGRRQGAMRQRSGSRQIDCARLSQTVRRLGSLRTKP